MIVSHYGSDFVRARRRKGAVNKRLSIITAHLPDYTVEHISFATHQTRAPNILSLYRSQGVPADPLSSRSLMKVKMIASCTASPPCKDGE